MPVSEHAEPGPADPKTGESWHRGNVLGHVAEMLPFWTAQLELASKGAGEVGRDESGYEMRREGVHRGDAANEAELRLEVDTGITGVLALLDGLPAEDLEREVLFHGRDGDRRARIHELIDFLVVGHFEEHVDQVAALS